MQKRLIIAGMTLAYIGAFAGWFVWFGQPGNGGDQMRDEAARTAMTKAPS